ncbi:MAG: hypothetical protein N3A58_04585 [Spirochaetes bacterium]|nr:hypothetical protein [Spirochaetota bacterium]
MKKFGISINLILHTFLFTYLFANNLILTFSQNNIENVLLFQKDTKIYTIEFFYNNDNEKKISFYYVNEYIIPILLKNKFTKIQYNSDLRLPIVSFENLTPIKVEYNIIKELDFKIIDYGDLNKNFQLLIIFSKQFENDFILRLVEFKIFNKDYKQPIFISGGVHIKIINNMIEIVNEF